MSQDTPHDSLFRFTFSQREQAIAHFRAHLPPALVSAVRWETLQLQPGSFVDQELQQLHSDLLYRVELQDSAELWLYVLFEHQSKPDPLMPWRVLRYMVRIWERALEQQRAPQRLPFVLPLVLYHGEPRWTVPTDFHAMFPDSPPTETHQLLLQHVPQFHYVLEDLSQLDDEQLQGEALWRLVLLFLKHARKRDFWQRFPAWLDAVAAVARQPPNGLKALEALWRYLQDVTPRELPEEVRASLAQRLPPEAQRWVVSWGEIVRERARQEGRQEGREQGREQGQRLLMLKVLRLKFGELPPEVTARVERATEQELDTWSERLFAVDTLEALLS